MDNALKCSIPLFKRRKPSTNFMDVIFQALEHSVTPFTPAKPV